MSFSQDTTSGIILAAIAAVGAASADNAATWRGDVALKAAEIATLLAPAGALARTIADMEDANVFVGTILSAAVEPARAGRESSNRVLVVVKTGTTREYPGIPAGCEPVRTERIDTPEGIVMARLARSLTGHKVTLWVGQEGFTNAKGDSVKVRMLRFVSSLGLSTDPEAVAARNTELARQASRSTA